MHSKYMESTFPKDKFDAVVGGATTSAYQIMNDVFGNTGWTYEIKQVQHGQKSTFVIATVYIPGIVRDGMAFGADAKTALEGAIMDVINTLKSKPVQQTPVQPTQQAPVQPPVQTAPPSTPPPSGQPQLRKELTRDEALAALMQMFHINKPQAEKLHSIRAKYSITTKQQLLKYLQGWNAEIKDSSELNATNIDAFAEWAENNQPEGFTAGV